MGALGLGERTWRAILHYIQMYTTANIFATNEANPCEILSTQAQTIRSSASVGAKLGAPVLSFAGE